MGVIAQVERRGATPGDQTPTVRLRWLLTDRQGSVETTWASGEDPEHHRYDAYGGVLAESGATTGERPSPTVSQGYTGHEHEDEVGLVNMGGRIYSPRLRRFLSADPIVAVPFGQGLNAYTYVMGDPMNWTDPSGWYREQPGYQLPADLRDPRGPTGPYGPQCDDNGGTCTYSETEGREDARAGDGSALERNGAGAAGAAPSRALDAASTGPVIVDLTNVADLIDLDVPGFDEGSGRITNFYDAARGAEALVVPLWQRTSFDGALHAAAEAAARELPMLHPGIALMRFTITALDPRVPEDQRVQAAALAVLTAVTLGAAAVVAIRGASTTLPVATRGMSRFGGVVSSSENAVGGTVVTADGLVQGGDFAGHVNAGMMRGGPVNILSGVHGSESGAMRPDPAILAEDVAMYGNLEGVTVHDTAALAESEVSGMVNGPGTTIGAFCNSGVCLAPFRR